MENGDIKKKTPSVVETDGALIDLQQSIHLQGDCNLNFLDSQELQSFYSDDGLISSSLEVSHELQSRFVDKKTFSGLLADSYKRLAESDFYNRIDVGRAYRVQDCGSRLVFAVQYGMKNKLVEANFCRDRLCPMCNWRRSLKFSSQLSSVVHWLRKNDKDYGYIFLTLTIRNCSSDDLNITIDNLFSGFKRLMKCKPVKSVVKGFFRSTEVTRNLDSVGTGLEWHPHLHILCAVPLRYFKSKDYLNHSKWVELWQRCLDVDYSPQVNIKRVKFDESDTTTLDKAILEVAKYATKSGDLFGSSDTAFIDSGVEALFDGLSSRRLTSFGGVFNKARKAMKMDVDEDGDLLHITPEDMLYNSMPVVHIGFCWSGSGYKPVGAYFV